MSHLNGLKNCVSKPVKEFGEIVKEFSCPSTLALNYSLNSIDEQESVDQRADRIMKELQAHGKFNITRTQVLGTLYSDGDQASIVRGLTFSLESFLQPLVALPRAAVRTLLLGLRIETILFHGTLRDVYKYTRHKLPLKNVTSNLAKRADNIFLSGLRLQLVPLQMLILATGSIIGIYSPVVGTKLRRQVYELDLTFDVKELMNTTSKTLNGYSAGKVKCFWLNKVSEKTSHYKGFNFGCSEYAGCSNQEKADSLSYVFQDKYTPYLINPKRTKERYHEEFEEAITAKVHPVENEKNNEESQVNPKKGKENSSLKVPKDKKNSQLDESDTVLKTLREDAIAFRAKESNNKIQTEGDEREEQSTSNAENPFHYAYIQGKYDFGKDQLDY